MSNKINPNGLIYLWINTLNNKKYLGSHWGKEDDGYVGSGVLFKKAVKKYDIENFVRIILEIKEYKDERELRKSEEFYLKNLNVVNKDIYYNLTDNCGCSIRSEESKLKQSKTITGRKQSKATVDKRMSKMRGVNHPQYKGIYITPNGTFVSSTEAAKYNNCTYRSIINRCKKNNNGWYFKPKEDISEPRE
jgi:hypothetical protein